MKTVLHINSSARIERSHTRGLTDLFLQEWKGWRPQDHIISRDIGIEPPPPVNEAWIAAAFILRRIELPPCNKFWASVN
jgi:FMN-dependent NADH-azoreductase